MYSSYNMHTTPLVPGYKANLKLLVDFSRNLYQVIICVSDRFCVSFIWPHWFRGNEQPSTSYCHTQLQFLQLYNYQGKTNCKDQFKNIKGQA